MGLDLETYKLLDVFDVESVYAKIRQLSTNKYYCPMDETNKYTLLFDVIYEKDDKQIANKHYNYTQDSVLLNLWEQAYKNLKEEFDKEGIKYTDKL